MDKVKYYVYFTGKYYKIYFLEDCDPKEVIQELTTRGFAYPSVRTLDPYKRIPGYSVLYFKMLSSPLVQITEDDFYDGVRHG